ncbi:MAG: sodium:solute symporter family protein [Methanothrix sp.]|nr:sodium:solute symporter family protein [Methanothrix sp.]MDD3710908.1 sodium:solute symporter family protein [Methanothrix sp.]MDD5769161.1 sodium:solute symporter family protein [Methanothrix sp.]
MNRLEFNFEMMAVVAVYFLGLVAVGAWASRKVRTSEDYILAGRNLGFWVFTILIVASICSGMTILGTSGLGYVTGWPTIWEQVFVPLSAAVCLLLFGTKLHAVGRERGYLTVQDYFADRFYSNNGIRGLSAVTGILVSLIYMVGQFVAISMVLSWLFGISYHAALMISALIVTAYVIMGGLYAVAWSSLIQGMMLIVGVLLVGPAVIRSAGGLSSINAVLAGIDPNFVQPWFPDWYPGAAAPYAGYAFATPIFLVSFFFLLSFGLASAPHVINNVFAARDAKYFKWAPLAAFSVYVVVMYLVKITGFAGRAMETEGQIALPSGVSNPSDYVFVLGAEHAFPSIISVLIGVIVLAAVMSTTDRLMLTIGTYFGWDIYKRFLRPDARDSTVTFVSRVAVAVAAVLTLILAWSNPPALLAWLIWMGIGLMLACYVAPLLAGLYWRRATREGAIFSMGLGLLGAGVAGYWYQFVHVLPVHFSLYGFALSILAIVVVSLATAKPSEEVLDGTMTGPYIRKRQARGEGGPGLKR